MGQMLFEILDCNGHRLHLGFCRRSLDSFQVVGWECGGRGLAGGCSDGVRTVANGAKKHFSGGILYIQWTSWKFWYPKRISSSNAQFLAFIIYVRVEHDTNPLQHSKREHFHYALWNQHGTCPEAIPEGRLVDQLVFFRCCVSGRVSYFVYSRLSYQTI